jgi:sn-glycerol 3-phosphate transport system substrate-binding protein
MQRNSFNRLLAATAIAAAAMPFGTQAQTQTEISFFYPVAVGGAIATYIDNLAADFTKENPTVKVKPIYAGSYQDTIVKALTAHKAGAPPVTSVLLSTDMFTLIDEDAIIPIDSFVKTADDKAWMNSFYKAFMLNSQTGGKTWGIPFQRSTIVLYYNKESFKAAGLDPNKAPATWAELADYAKKLTVKDSSGKVSQYGIQIPSSGFPYWLFQALAIQNDVVMANDTGNAVKFDDPKVIEALQYWVDLSKSGVHPAGIVEWGTTPKDFFEKKVAMMWTTTGNLTNVRKNAKFDFGVAIQEVDPGPAGSRVQVHQVGDAA